MKPPTSGYYASIVPRLARDGFTRRHLDQVRMLVNGNGPWSQSAEWLTSKMGSGGLYILVGPRGTGKTMMATRACMSVAQGIANTGSEQTGCKYTTAMDLYLTIKETYDDQARLSEKAALALYTKPRVLVIDEVQERARSEWEQRLLTLIVDKRYSDGAKDTIIIGNLKPEELTRELGPSIMSRAVETGKILVCDWPSYRKRVD